VVASFEPGIQYLCGLSAPEFDQLFPQFNVLQSQDTDRRQSGILSTSFADR
jgi:hypothetical protein